MINGNQAWRKAPITLDEWKENCYASPHVRKGDTLIFHEDRDVFACWIQGTSFFLGSFFPKGSPQDGILPNTGWNH